MSSGLLTRFHLRHTPTAGAAGGRANGNNQGGQEDNNGHREERNNTPELFPAAAGQRRPRSESMENEAQQEEKRRKQFAASLCAAKGLPEDAMESFIGLNAADMMISIRADILQMQMQGRKSDAEKFIESEDFKDILKDRLKACLLSPNLTAYVTGLGDQIFAFAKKNLQTFKIPEAALEDPEMSDKVILLIKDLLTNQRSNMKQKIANHITSKSHISILARALSPGGGYEMTAAHWARIAFLRDSLTEFESVVEASAARAAAEKRRRRSRTRSRAQSEDDTEPNHDDPNQDDPNQDDESERTQRDKDELNERIWVQADFWEYVDLVLRVLRAEAREAENTPAGRAKHLEVTFTGCLQTDLQLYPGTTSNPALPAFDRVTVPWQKAIHAGLIWSY